MKKTLQTIIVCIALGMISSCVKECYHCTEMMVTTNVYTKGNDTIRIVQMGAYYDYESDTLLNDGYNGTRIESTIPVDVDYCKEKNVDVYYYQACTKVMVK